MKIKLSKSQWEGIGKKAGWTGNPTLAPEQEDLIKRVEQIIDQMGGDDDLRDMLQDAVSETLEANAKGLKGKGLVREFANMVNERIKTWQAVLLQISQIAQPK